MDDMNAPWWRFDPAHLSTTSDTRPAADEPETDLLPPFVD